MTARSPLYLENAGAVYNAIEDRQLIRAQTPSHGVFFVGDLVVTQRGAGANRSVDVAAGSVAVAGTESAPAQGYYFQHHDATTNLPLDASDPSNPRYDLIVQRFRDSEASGVNDDGALVVVKGTAAASPAEPAVPANSLVLARVTVGAGVTSITNANIVDRRVYASSAGALHVVTSGTRPATPRPFEVIAETDTGKTLRRNAANGTWEPFGNVILCTSSTRPTQVFNGLTIWETDTFKLLVYSTVTSTWNPPWNLSWGVLTVGGDPSGTANIALGTGGAETSAVVSTGVPIPANRKIRVAGYVNTFGSGGFYARTRIRRGNGLGGSVRTSSPMGAADAGFGGDCAPYAEAVDTGYTPGATVQWTLSGSGGDLRQPSLLIIEDVGPNAAPA